MSVTNAVLLVALSALWGGSFLFIRVAVPTFGPLPLSAVRLLIAAAALYAFAALSGRRPALGANRRRFVVLGASNAAIPFALIAVAELRIGASLASILNATVPLFSVFVAHRAYGAPLRAPQIAGALIGLAGVAALVGVGGVSGDPLTLVAVAASLLAALSFAFGAVYAARSFPGRDPLELAIGQQLGAAALLVPGALLTLPRAVPPAEAVAALLALALLSTTFASVIFFRLVSAIGATGAVAVTFLIPPFGVLLGVLFLGEEASASLVLGLALILTGVALVTGLVAGPRGRARVERG